MLIEILTQTTAGYLLRVEVLLAICILLEKLTRSVTEELVICNLELESARVPRIIEVDIVRVNKCQFFVCENDNKDNAQKVLWKESLTGCLCSENILA